MRLREVAVTTIKSQKYPTNHQDSYLGSPNTQFETYSHLFNKRGAWNKRGGGAIVVKSLNVEVGKKGEGGIFREKLVHKSNKRGVEEGKI